MDLSQEETHFLDSSEKSESIHAPLNIKKRPRSNSFSLGTCPYGLPPNLPPSSSTLPDPGTKALGERSVDLPPITGLLHRSESSPSLDLGSSRPPSPATSDPDLTPPRLRNVINPFTLRPMTALKRNNYNSEYSNQKNGRNLWNAIQETGAPIYLGTPGFDVFSLCPFALGTYCSPTAVLSVFKGQESANLLYAAGRKLTKENLTPSKCDAEGGVLQYTADVVLAEYGGALLKHNSGPHFTFVIVKEDTISDEIVRKTRGLVQRFEANGVTKDQIIISIPATEQGVHATRLLVNEDEMLINLAMVAGVQHAAVCAEAGAAWITFHLDRMERVYKNLGVPPHGTKEIQRTIALFDRHKIQTKVMVSGFRDTNKVLELPGVHGFSITKEQIVAARLHTMRSCYVPASSLPNNSITDVKWPPQFFDSVEAGGSNGSFVQCFPSRVQTIIRGTQTDMFNHTRLALVAFLSFIRDEVVNYNVLMLQLMDPRSGTKTLERESLKQLKSLVYETKDLETAEHEWKNTVSGRMMPVVEWVPMHVDTCEVWVTRGGKIQAQIPKAWVRKELLMDTNDSTQA